MAIHFRKNDFYTYYYDHIVNPTVNHLYVHLGRVIFHTTELFSPSPIFMSIDSATLVLSNIRDFYRLTPTCFFLLFCFSCFPVGRWIRNGNIFDDRLILPLILPSTNFIALPLFLNHHRFLFILRSERDLCVSSCSEYFQYWVRFDGDHSIDLRRKLVGWFLYGIYRFYLVYFRWIVSLP